LSAGGDVNLQANIDATADAFGTTIDIESDGVVGIGGQIRTTTPINSTAVGGSIAVRACQVNLPSFGELIATGPGDTPSGRIYLDATNGMVIAGHVTSTYQTLLRWRSSAPVLTGATFSPSPTIVQDASLPCCGSGC